MSKTIEKTKTYYIVKLTDRGDDRYLCMVRHSDHPEWQPSQSSFPKDWATKFDSIEEIPKVNYREYDIVKVTESIVIEKEEEVINQIRGWRD